MNPNPLPLPMLKHLSWDRLRTLAILLDKGRLNFSKNKIFWHKVCRRRNPRLFIHNYGLNYNIHIYYG